MKSDDIVPYLTPGDRPDLGFRQGTVIAWDDAGSNTIEIAGQQFTDLPVIASGSLMIGVGDVVAVIRFRSTYLIAGVITTAGAGALGTRAVFLDAAETTNSASPTDLATVGPVVTVYIGASRRCLVFMTANIFVVNDSAAMTFAVSGASSIDATVVRDQAANVFSDDPDNQYGGSASSTQLLTADEGLQQGINTFTAKYWSTNGNSPIFAKRRLAVMPF